MKLTQSCFLQSVAGGPGMSVIAVAVTVNGSRRLGIALYLLHILYELAIPLVLPIKVLLNPIRCFHLQVGNHTVSLSLRDLLFVQLFGNDSMFEVVPLHDICIGILIFNIQGH